MGNNDSLLLALANQAGEVDPSPWSGAGASILQSQLPKATNNTEAILGPILQGLIGGGMYGYGQGQTNRDAFQSYAQNPIIQSLGGDTNIGPVANGNEYGADLLAEAYGSGEMPASWTPQQGKSDLISALITRNAIDDEEEKKREIRDSLNKTLATQGKMLDSTGSTVIAMPGYAEAKAQVEGEALPGSLSAFANIPNNLRVTAAKEAQDIDTKDKAVKAIDTAFDAAGKVSTASSLVPRSDSKIQFEAAKASVLTALTALWKGPMSEGDRKSIDPLLPSIWDTEDQLKKKKEGLAAVVEAQQGESPLMGAIRTNLGKEPAKIGGNAPTPPAGYELTGKQDANGNYGIRKIR